MVLLRQADHPATILARGEWLYTYRNPDQPPLAKECRQIKISNREMLPIINGVLLAAGFPG